MVPTISNTPTTSKDVCATEQKAISVLDDVTVRMYGTWTSTVCVNISW